MSMSRRNRAFIEAALATMFWGASFVAMKIAVNETSPSMIVWFRSLAGFGVLSLWLWKRKNGGTYVAPKDLLYMAALGLMGVTFHNLIQAEALKTAQAATSAWIVSTTPLIIALFGRIFLKERIAREGVIGLFSAALGVLLVLGEGSSLLPKGITVGDLLISLSAINWAAFTVISRKFLERRDQIVSLFYIMSFGWLFSNIPAYFSGFSLSFSWQAWISLLFLGVLCSGIAYIFWYEALYALPASQVGVFMYLNPLTATITAVILLSESLSLKDATGALLVLLGLWMVNRKKSNAPQVENSSLK
ncbi:DMT family transporter [Acetomicrobium hydrogeniformans]|uniref:Putative membrane protein n=1 Tax=Acetomicrobium hydrogeniformans ATCC BAA-1850 TaxID=592015 RepID=A0A0T5XAG5_9BACT|nr:DMT family transporter [Acetomicrobium hydrogeniformans]KRT35368.1 putative membrane protein [Acetomicrobium hydrogeniformans ATCC BAA-1850]